MFRRFTGFIIIGILVLAASGSATAEDDWPHWRGPHLNGTSDSTNLPTEWTKDKNILWRTELPAWSGSTPIVWDDKIFVISPTKAPPADQTQPNERQGERGNRQGDSRDRDDQRRGDQKKGEQKKSEQADRGGQRGDRAGRGRGNSQRRGGGRRRGGRGGRMRGPASPGGQELMLMCFSKSDGKLIWEKQIDKGNRMYRKGNSSSPSPVTDGNHVWTLTGNGQLTAFNMDGKEIWSTNLQEMFGDFGLGWGYASSPTLHDGKLIIQVLHGRRTDDPSYVVAFEASSGGLLWRQERPTDAPNESPDAYTTPMILKHDGKTQVVISGGDYITGHDIETGKEVWRSAGLNPTRASNYRVVSSPLITKDLIIAPTRRRPVTALRPGGMGDVTESHRAWQFDDRGGPDVPTPISDGERIYLVDDSGIVTCLDPSSGEIVWGPERTAEGTVSASPLLADGKIYITNEKAVTTVIKAGDQFEVVSTNQLDDSYTLSSIAVSGENLFIRTANALYCIGRSDQK